MLGKFQTLFAPKARPSAMQTRVRDVLPLVEIHSDGCTILTKNGYAIQVISYEGELSFGMSSKDLEASSSQRNTFLKSLDEDYHYSFVSGCSKQSIFAQEGAGDFLSSLKEPAFEEYMAKENYILISRKLKDPQKEERKDLIEKLGLWGGVSEYDISQFSQSSRRVVSQLKDHGAKIVTLKTGLKNLLNEMINGVDTGVSCLDKSHSLHKILGQSGLDLTESGMLIYRGNEHVIYSSHLGVIDYPERITPKLFEKLRMMNIPMRIVQHVMPCSAIEQLKKVDQLSQKYEYKKFGQSYIKESLEAGSLIERKDVAFHDHVAYIMFFAASESELEENINRVQSFLKLKGVTSYIEDSHMVYYQYLGQFADYHADLDARKNVLSSANLADLLCFSGIPKGFKSSTFGDGSVAQFRTIDGSLYDFNFHVSDEEEEVGHTLIIGANGSGKTTFLSYLLANCLKYDGMRVLAFDAGEGMYVPTKALGGDYNNIFGDDCDLKLNPFHLEAGTANKKFLSDFISMLAGGLDVEEERAVQDMLSVNDDLTKDGITQKNLSTLIENCEGTDLHDRLIKWTDPDSVSSNLFNNYEDSLSFNKQLVTFNMPDELLKDSNTLNILTSYLFHCFLKVIKDGKPSIIPVDEFPMYFESDIFASRLIAILKKIRKRRGMIIGSMQNVTTLTKSKYCDDLISNCGRLVIFPNGSASREDYVDRLGLSDTLFEWIKTFTEYAPEGARACLVVNNQKGSQEAVVLNIDLSGLGENLKLLESGSSNVKKVKAMVAKYGEKNWVKEYLKEARNEV